MNNTRLTKGIDFQTNLLRLAAALEPAVAETRSTLHSYVRELSELQPCVGFRVSGGDGNGPRTSSRRTASSNNHSSHQGSPAS